LSDALEQPKNQVRKKTPRHEESCFFFRVSFFNLVILIFFDLVKLIINKNEFYRLVEIGHERFNDIGNFNVLFTLLSEIVINFPK
jgi:hypothetical protein